MPSLIRAALKSINRPSRLSANRRSRRSRESPSAATLTQGGVLR
jgi:hypothetical protein